MPAPAETMGALEFTMAADHPAAAGHFPGNPIIPGAILLAETLHALGRRLGTDFAQCSIRSAKFPAPSRPGDRIDVRFHGSAGRISLVCSVSGLPVLKAEIAGVEVACSAKASPD